MEDEEYDATLLLSSADVGVSEKVDVASLAELVMVELYEIYDRSHCRSSRSWPSPDVPPLQ